MPVIYLSTAFPPSEFKEKRPQNKYLLVAGVIAFSREVYIIPTKHL